MLRTLLLTCTLAALLSGCAGDADPQSHGSAALSHNGSGAGSHDDSADCDDDATLAGTGSIDEGSIEVTVTDGDGAEKFSKTFDDKVDAEAEHMEGAAGDWTLTVTRVPDAILNGEFEGSYSFTLTC